MSRPSRLAPLDRRQSDFTRVGELAPAGRVAQAITHNHDLRVRLIAMIHADARCCGLGENERRALQRRLTGAASCSDMTLQQLRRVAAELHLAAKRMAPETEET